MEEEKHKKEKEQTIDALKREVDLLKSELDFAYDLQKEADKNAMLLERLFEDDVIDADGKLKNPISCSQEREQ